MTTPLALSLHSVFLQYFLYHSLNSAIFSYHLVSSAVFLYHSVNSAIVLYPIAVFRSEVQCAEWKNQN